MVPSAVVVCVVIAFVTAVTTACCVTVVIVSAIADPTLPTEAAKTAATAKAFTKLVVIGSPPLVVAPAIKLAPGRGMSSGRLVTPVNTYAGRR